MATGKGSSSVTDRYLAEFDARSRQAKGSPDWLKELRRKAMSRFAEVGFPSTREEDWRFTSVRAIAEAAFTLPGDAVPAVTPSDVEPFLFGVGEGPRLVFVNGTFRPSLSRIGSLPVGVHVESIGQALETQPELVEEHLGKHAPYDASSFAALNTAFADEGAFVYLPPETTLPEPIQLVHLASPGAERALLPSRNVVVVDRGANLQFVESYAGVGNGLYLTNTVTEVVVGDYAKVDGYRVQRETDRAYHVAGTHSRQGRESRYSMTVVPLGAALSRHDVRLVLDGEGGEGVLNGLYVMRDRQHVDHNTVMVHAKPHCTSHEYFNGILDDHARAVFNGRIVVRPGAQKTDSKQTNNNLLLSGDARADSQPQLEIYADDVRCTHGATLGPLDENALFYLRSRGIDERSARALLTFGFSAEVLEKVMIAGVRHGLEGLVRGRLRECDGRRRAA